MRSVDVERTERGAKHTGAPRARHLVFEVFFVEQFMRWTVRVFLSVILVTVPAMVFAAAAPARVPLAKGPKIKRTEACTVLSADQAKTLGQPVVVSENDFLGPYDCDFLIGADPSQAPGGRLSVIILYPFYGPDFPNAVSALQDQYATDALSEHDLRDVDGIGVSAFFDETGGSIKVAATKKFAFALTWRPANVDGALTAPVRKKLVKLAKNIVKRAP
jgi:hypothetical protein